MGNHDAAVIFVFDGPDGVLATYGEDAPFFRDNSEYRHLATVDPRAFIEAHYAAIARATRRRGQEAR